MTIVAHAVTTDATLVTHDNALSNASPQLVTEDWLVAWVIE